MSKVLINELTLRNIADAIRGKLHTDAQYKPREMPSAIESIVATTSSDDFEKFLLKKTEELYIPESVTNFNFSLYGYTKLRKVVFPVSCTSINASMGNCTALEEVVFPEYASSFSTSFSGCTSLRSVKLPNSIVSLPSDLFYQCRSLTTIDIPPNVSVIGSSCFANCGLTSVVIPENVTSLNSKCFQACPNLAEVEFLGMPIKIDAQAFLSVSNVTIKVPWYEGDVSGAPWGASNATLIYEYMP